MGGRPLATLLARDETEDSELLRRIATVLLAPGTVRSLVLDAWDFAAERLVPAEVLERIDRASKSRKCRFRSGVDVQVDASVPSRPSRLLLPSEDGDTIDGRRAGRCCRRVKVLSSNPLKASINLLPSASTCSISFRMSFALCRCSSSKTSSIFSDDDGLNPGPIVSAPDRRAL